MDERGSQDVSSESNSRLPDAPQKEAGPGAAGVWRRGAVRQQAGSHAVEEECAARAVGHGGVEAEVQQFVPHLEGVSSVYLGQVVAERYGLVDQPVVAVADQAP